MTRTVYYVLPDVRAEEFRAQAGAYIQGVPQPPSVAGLVYALGLSLQRTEGITLEHAPGVAYGIRNWSGLSGISLNKSSKKEKARESAAIDDRVRASATLTLFLELVLSDESPVPSVEALITQLSKMRLQSASLFCSGRSLATEDIREAIKWLPADAFFLTDASADFKEALLDQPVTWTAMAELICRPSDKEVYKPRFVPAFLGWAPLSKPVARSQRREDAIAHVVAEPVLGLAQFRSKGSFRVLALDPDALLFWRHSEVLEPSLHYVVRGTPAFTPEIQF
jgi:hypothetical protein